MVSLSKIQWFSTSECLYRQTALTSRVFGVGSTSGAWGVQIIILEVDSDSLWSVWRRLNTLSGHCPFFLVNLSKFQDIRTKFVRLPNSLTNLSLRMHGGVANPVHEIFLLSIFVSGQLERPLLYLHSFLGTCDRAK